VPSIPLALIAATIPEELLHLAYGGGYQSAADALRLLAPAIVLYPISFLCGYMLVAQGHVRPLVTVYGIVAAENVALNLVLIPAFSLEGAAIGTTISEALAALGLGLVARAKLREER
jgi:O-antigen/teichoic acid export membrane protein